MLITKQVKDQIVKCSHNDDSDLDPVFFEEFTVRRITGFHLYLVLWTFWGIWKDYTPLSHPFRMDQIINAVEITCHFWARSFKRLWGISMPCDTLGSHMLGKQQDEMKGTYLWVTGWRTCFTQPTGLSIMKIKLLFNFLTTRGYLHQLKSYKEIIVEGSKYHIRSFEEQFSWEDHMQELNLQRQVSFVTWQWGEKNSSQNSQTKVRTCRTLPIILQALS